MKKVSQEAVDKDVGGVITARQYPCTNYNTRSKICPEVEECEDLPKAQLCVDTIRRAIVSMHLLNTTTGELIRCGSGCVVDSSRGLIVTGGQILRRPNLHRSRRERQMNKDKQKRKGSDDNSKNSNEKASSSCSEPTMIPIIEIPVPRTRNSDSTFDDKMTSRSSTKYQYFTASIMVYHIANNQELCVLALGQYIVPTAHSGGYNINTITKKDKEPRKKSFVSNLSSFLGGLSLTLGCTEPKCYKTILPLPLAVRPISKSQMKSLHEIRIDDGKSNGVGIHIYSGSKSMNIHDPDLAITGYFEGRRSPFWANSFNSDFIKLRITKTRDSDLDTDPSAESVGVHKPTDDRIVMQTTLSLGTEMVGSSFINGDGVLTGMVCKRIYVEAGFVSTCSASYHVAEAHLLKKLVTSAQRKYDTICLELK